MKNYGIVLLDMSSNAPLRKFHCNLIKRININFYMLISMLRKTHTQFKAYLDKEDEYNLSWYFICHGTIPL